VANSQHGRNVRLGLFAAATGTTAAVDTTAATTIVISVQKATAGDTVKLESYSVELIPG
jgi:hypothetical protein